MEICPNSHLCMVWQDSLDMNWMKNGEIFKGRQHGLVRSGNMIGEVLFMRTGREWHHGDERLASW